MSLPATLLEAKPDEDLIENFRGKDIKDADLLEVHAVAEQRHDLLKSRFDELSLLQTLWVFRRVVLYSFMIYTLNMLDGRGEQVRGLSGADMQQEYGIIQRTLEHEKLELEASGATRYKDIFTGRNRMRTMIITVFFTAELLGGLAMISTYSTYFFAIAGLTDPFLGSLILSCVNLATILAFTVTVDKIGRRRPVTWSYTFTSLTLWLIGALYYVPGDSVKIVLLVLCAIWSAAFTVVGNLYWLLAAELPSAQLRLKTVSFSLLIAASWGIITCFAVPPLLVHLNLRGSFVFGATSLPCLIILWLYLPETKGRAAAEIDELYRNKVPAWRWAKTKTAVEEQMHAVVAAQRALQQKEEHAEGI